MTQVDYKIMLFKRTRALLFYGDIEFPEYSRLVHFIKGDNEFQNLAETLIENYEHLRKINTR